MSERRLVVSADDFGAANEVNRAVELGHRDGVLSNASLMVTGAAAAGAVEVARRLPRLGVGLHLVLVQGVPAAPPAEVRALVGPDGAFPAAPVAGGIRYAWLALSRAGTRALRAEVEAQLVAFARTGLPLSHVDGHLHLHLHPMVLPILLDLAPRYGVRAMRVPREPLGRAIRHDGRHVVRRSLEGVVFAALGRWAAPRLRAAGIAVPSRAYGMHHTGRVDARYLRALLAGLPEGTSEVYCHPATGDRSHDPFQRGYRNAAELAALLDPEVRDVAAARGVAFVSYHALTS